LFDEDRHPVGRVITRLYRVASEPAAVRVRVEPNPSELYTAAGAGPGGAPVVTVFNPDGSVRGSFLAYEPSFTGGVSVAVAAVDADTYTDVVTGAGPGGGPVVKVFSGFDFHLVASVSALEDGFRGGVEVAGGDTDGDGLADVVAGAGPGGGPRVVVFTHP